MIDPAQTTAPKAPPPTAADIRVATERLEKAGHRLGQKRGAAVLTVAECKARMDQAQQEAKDAAAEFTEAAAALDAMCAAGVALPAPALIGIDLASKPDMSFEFAMPGDTRDPPERVQADALGKDGDDLDDDGLEDEATGFQIDVIEHQHNS